MQVILLYTRLLGSKKKEKKAMPIRSFSDIIVVLNTCYFLFLARWYLIIEMNGSCIMKF